MSNCVGSRGYSSIDFNATCNISGIELNSPLPALCFYGFKSAKAPHIIVERRFAEYCPEFLCYKFGITKIAADYALLWSRDEWAYPNDRVYRADIRDDYKTTLNILLSINKQWVRSDNVLHNER